MIKETQTVWCAKTLRMTSWLREHGFEAFRECEDKNNRTKKVWLFMITPAFKEALEQYWQEKKEYILQ